MNFLAIGIYKAFRTAKMIVGPKLANELENPAIELGNQLKPATVSSTFVMIYGL
jgi:hypothetical protein